MAPLTIAPRTEKERSKSVLGRSPRNLKIQRVCVLTVLLAFGKKLEDLFSTSTGLKISPSLVDELESNIQSFPLSLGAAVAREYDELERSGTRLWNLSARLKGCEGHKSAQILTVLAMARLYSLLMLDCAHSSGNGSPTNVVRVMRVALKTAKGCLDLRQFDFALKALEKAAEYEELLKNSTTNSTQEETEANANLISEYFVLRAILEWRQDRLEVAEHMYAKASLSEKLLGPSTAESLADLLFEMGRELLGKKQFDMSVKWLERAFAVLNSHALDKLSSDASELRTSIIQCSVKALLGVGQENAKEQADNLVRLLENDVGDKLIVLLLRLELLSVSGATFDSLSFGTVLQRIIQTVTLTEPNFKLIMHHIRTLNDKAPSLACNILDEFLQNRVFEASNDGWLGTVLVNRLWMAISQRDGADVLYSVRQILDMVLSNAEKPLGPPAAFAAQTLLWKRIESNFATGQHETAEAWCRLALHPVFQNAGDLNKDKIARKLLLCALARLDLGEAREIYGALSETAKNNHRTRFLMYKVAIRSGDMELASDCLEVIHQGSSKDPSLLYACVLDAQEFGDETMVIEALQLLLEKHQLNPASTLQLPGLLRCLVRLLNSQLDSKSNSLVESSNDRIANQLGKLFEGAAAQAKRSNNPLSSAPKLFDTIELDWFSKNAYNLALTHAGDWAPRRVLQILQSCITLIGLYPEDIDQQASDDLSLRLIFCHFLAAVLLITLARAEDNLEVQLQDYLLIRKNVDNFDKILQVKLEKLEEGPAEDLVKKLSILLAYDFEAAVRLKKWEDLSEIIMKSAICKSIKVYELMADCMLCCEAPAEVTVLNLKRIVNAVWELEAFDISKLSRYLRCLFQYALPHSNYVAEDILDQIYNLAREALEGEQPYPSEEVEWISTTAFNRAVDLYCAGEDVACKTWASKAIIIASCCDDGGELQGILENKLLGLSWER